MDGSAIANPRFGRLIESRHYALRQPDERMNATPQPKPTEPEARTFDLRGGSFTALVLNLVDLKDPGFFQWLLDKIAQAPNFYRNAPVVLDLDGLADAGPFNFAELGRRLRQHQLMPIGVQNGTEEQNRGAANAGLAVFPMWRQTKPVAAEPPVEAVKDAESAQPAPAPASGGSKVITDTIRSGRQVYAQGGDLVVLSTVSAGAELLADGHVHIYGALRGRVLAGVCGDTEARIFCRSLDAELVSVAGHWLVRDDIDERLIGRTVQIYLKGGGLVIEPLG